MQTFVQFLIIGLGAGGMYALGALGIVIVYRGSGVVNFAHGAIAMLGAYTYFEIVEAGGAKLVGLAAGIALSAAVGVLFYLLVLSRMQEASVLARMVATLGLLTAVQAAATLHYGDSVSLVPSVLPTDGVTLFGVTVTVDSLILLGLAAAISLGLWAIWRFTTFGVVTTAAAESERAAAALGRSPARVAAANWAVGSALAGAAGILVSPVIGLSVQTMGYLLFPCLAAALLGSFASFSLTFIGGLGIGVAEAELTNYVSVPGWSSAGPLLAIIVLLAVAGKTLPVRGFLAERFPDVGTGRIRLHVLVPALAVGLLLTFLLNPTPAKAIGVSAVAGIVCLSIIVVTGYAGQLSLAQFGIAGIGALVAANASAHLHTPFPIALLLAVIVVVPIGMLLSLPALRVRGVSLAIITLCVALVLERLVFTTPSFTGGLDGLTVDVPGLGPLSLDPVAHPQRYAAFSLVMFALVGVAVANLRRGASGMQMIAIRGNERAALAMGIPVNRVKLFACGIAAGIAALAGALTAFQTELVQFEQFTTLASVNFAVIAALGGIGAASGSLFGALAASGGIISLQISEAVDSTQWLLLVTGVMVMVSMVIAPDGAALDMVKRARQLRARFGTASAQEPPTAETADERKGRPALRPPSTLAVRDVSISFGSNHVLDAVSFEVRPGRVLGMIGPNGAGKTTLVDIVSGLQRPDAGEVLLDGAPINRLSADGRARRGLVRSFQSLELFEGLTIRENLAVVAGQAKTNLVRDLVWPRAPRLSTAAMTAVTEFGLAAALDKRPAELSYGMRRLAAIARAVAANPSVLLLDEPAAGLDEHETKELARIVRLLVEEWNLAVLLIEHNVNFVMGVSDEVIALDFGHVIAHGDPEKVRAEPAVVRAYLGTEAETEATPAAAEPPAAVPARRSSARAASGAGATLEASALSAGYGAAPAIRDIDLVVRPGEIVGLLGANGAGKTTTLLTLAGAIQASAGEVRWDGAAAHDGIARRTRRGLGLVPEERSVFSRLTVAENLRVGQGDPEVALALFPELRAFVGKKAGLLSGGQQQMLTLGRALAARPSVLLIDELSLGLAPVMVDRLLPAVQDAAAAGVAVLLVEQHLRTVLSVADRAYVLQEGRIVLEGTGAELRNRTSEIEAVYLAGPVEAPAAG